MFPLTESLVFIKMFPLIHLVVTLFAWIFDSFMYSPMVFGYGVYCVWCLHSVLCVQCVVCVVQCVVFVHIKHYTLHDCTCVKTVLCGSWNPEAVDDIGDIEVHPLPQFSSQRHRFSIEMIMRHLGCFIISLQTCRMLTF